MLPTIDIDPVIIERSGVDPDKVVSFKEKIAELHERGVLPEPTTEKQFYAVIRVVSYDIAEKAMYSVVQNLSNDETKKAYAEGCRSIRDIIDQLALQTGVHPSVIMVIAEDYIARYSDFHADALIRKQLN